MTWKVSTGSLRGLFDIIGMETPYNLSKSKPGADEPGSTQYKVVKLFEKMIEEGKLGVQSGEDFYTYDK